MNINTDMNSSTPL